MIQGLDGVVMVFDLGVGERVQKALFEAIRWGFEGVVLPRCRGWRDAGGGT